MKTKHDISILNDSNKQESYNFSGRRRRQTGNRNSYKENIIRKDVRYQCPMQCHGDKTFDRPGICPDSKMQMIPVRAGHIFIDLLKLDKPEVKYALLDKLDDEFRIPFRMHVKTFYILNIYRKSLFDFLK